MKRLFTYISTALFGCLLFTSCSQDADYYAASVPQGPIVQLQLMMPSDGSSPYAARATKPADADGLENGKGKENDISLSPLDLHIFVFDSQTKSYIGKATQLKYMQSPSDKSKGMVDGLLPQETAGKQVELVLMANYDGRHATPVAPTAVTLTDWLDQNTFDFSKSTWQYRKTYLPMSGTTSLKVKPMSHYENRNYGAIELTRAVAQVRIEVKSTSSSPLNGITVKGAQNISYSLQQPDGSVYAGTQKPITNLNFPDLTITPGKSYSFYIPEQAKDLVTLGLTFKDKKEHTVEFAKYANNKPQAGSEYPVKRNYLYLYTVSKKEEGKFDVQSSVMPWVSHDLTPNYE